MFPPPTDPVKVKPKKGAKPPVPFMCAQAARGTSACGRFLQADEAFFNDPAWAAKWYSNGTTLRLCPDCLVNIRRAEAAL